MNELLSSLAIDYKKPRSGWITVASFSLAALLLYISFRGIDWLAIYLILKKINFAWLPFFLLASTLSYLLRAFRWRILIKVEKPLEFLSVFWSNMAGYLANNILPARAGEIIRAAILGKLAAINPGFILATGLVERVMDLIALVIIGASALSLTGIISSGLKSALLIMSFIGLIGLTAMLLFPHFSDRVSYFVESLHFIKPAFKNLFINSILQFSNGIASLTNWHQISGFIALTTIIWILDGLLTAFLASLFEYPLSITQALVLLSGMGLSSAIPSTPGYIGVYQFVAILILVPFGMNRETALAFILVLQLMGLITVTLLGLLSILNINRILRNSKSEYST